MWLGLTSCLELSVDGTPMFSQELSIPNCAPGGLAEIHLPNGIVLDRLSTAVGDSSKPRAEPYRPEQILTVYFLRTDGQEVASVPAVCLLMGNSVGRQRSIRCRAK